jgi:peroxiredoxin
MVAGFSVYELTRQGPATAGVPAGHRLRLFAAPLAASTLNGDANVTAPTCDPAHHDPRALNLCLLARHGPLVLAFFVTGSRTCARAVDTLQRLRPRFRRVQFAAVAVQATHRQTAALVTAHRWTIPVAYDRDGAVGALYGVVVCPLLELARRGGRVLDRLIGERWLRDAALAPRVGRLVG